MVRKPGEPGVMPATIESRSKVGCALQAWESERVGSGVSAQVERPSWSILRQGSSCAR